MGMLFKDFRRVALFVTGSLLILMLVPVLYFQWHSSEASTLSAVSGALALRDPNRLYIEIESGVYMFRRVDLKVADDGVGSVVIPVNTELVSHGWTFEEQMGAGLLYKRGDQTLEAIFASCGPHYGVAVLHQDPATGCDIARSKPFNLFSW